MHFINDGCNSVCVQFHVGAIPRLPNASYTIKINKITIEIDESQNVHFCSIMLVFLFVSLTRCRKSESTVHNVAL